MEMRGNVTLQHTHVGDTIVPHHTHRYIVYIRNHTIKQNTFLIIVLSLLTYVSSMTNLIMKGNIHVIIPNYNLIWI